MTRQPQVREKILSILGNVIPSGVSLHEPEFAGKEWEYVKDCLDTGWVSTAGQYVETFEGMLTDFTGAGHAIVTMCCGGGLGTGTLLQRL